MRACVNVYVCVCVYVYVYVCVRERARACVCVLPCMELVDRPLERKEGRNMDFNDLSSKRSRYDRAKPMQMSTVKLAVETD